MDPSHIPIDILRVLQDKRLSMPQKMMAFNMLIPNLPADQKHTDAYNSNLEIGEKIKKLIDDGKIRIDGFDSNFMLKISKC